MGCDQTPPFRITLRRETHGPWNDQEGGALSIQGRTAQGQHCLFCFRPWRGSKPSLFLVYHMPAFLSIARRILGVRLDAQRCARSIKRDRPFGEVRPCRLRMDAADDHLLDVAVVRADAEPEAGFRLPTDE